VICAVRLDTETGCSESVLSYAAWGFDWSRTSPLLSSVISNLFYCPTKLLVGGGGGGEEGGALFTLADSHYGFTLFVAKECDRRIQSTEENSKSRL
jgi:hypothetical protein